jgi:hypothetical protein
VRGHTRVSRSRSITWVLVAVAALVVALLAGFALRDRVQPAAQATPLQTASPAAVSASPSANASGSPAALPSAAVGTVLSDGFGFVISESGGSSYVRSETSDTSLGAFSATQVAASPDGSQLAYLTSGTPRQLRVRAVTGSSERVVLTFADADNVVGITWSSDGGGLAYGVGAGADVGPGSPDATLRTVEVSTGATAVIARRTDGRIYRPIAWDRAAKLVAAAESGAGGFMSAYVVVDLSQDPPRVSSGTLPGRAAIGRASSDAKFVFTTDVDSGALRWWPLGDYAAAKVVLRASLSGSAWKPGTSQVAWIEGPGGSAGSTPVPENELLLYDVRTGTRTTVAKSQRLTGSFVKDFRPDGSAAILASQSAGDVTVFELASGRMQAITARGIIGSWVRLR